MRGELFCSFVLFRYFVLFLFLIGEGDVLFAGFCFVSFLLICLFLLSFSFLPLHVCLAE